MNEKMEQVLVQYHDSTLEEMNAVEGQPTLMPNILRGVFLRWGSEVRASVEEVVAVGPGACWDYDVNHMAAVSRSRSGVRISRRVDMLMREGPSVHSPHWRGDYVIIPRPNDWPWKEGT